MDYCMPDGNAIGLYLTFSKNSYPILISRATGLCATPRQTKIGYTNTSFYERMNQYRIQFRGRFEFWPIVEVHQQFLVPMEKAVIDAMNDRYGSFMARRSGEWFDTGDRLQDRIAVRDLMLRVAHDFDSSRPSRVRPTELNTSNVNRQATLFNPSTC